MARRHVHHVRLVKGVGRRPEALEDGKVRCLCGAVVGLTRRGIIRAHLTPKGDECAHHASYASVELDEIPPVSLPPASKERAERVPRERVAPAERPPSRLDVGSECRECGKWLPGERSLCGRCFATRSR